MNCPSCHAAMEALTLHAHLGTPLQIDACWGCQLIWFDPMESTALAPQSVIELFRRIHATHGASRNIVAMSPACPRCAEPLALTHDLARGGNFSYQRCPSGHGRLISFTQFLREKSFIRSLNPAEIQRLAATVKQIRCSSCGAPINLDADTACSHCGAAISVLDEQAVQKALDDYASRAAPPLRVSSSPSPATSAAVPAGSWTSGNGWTWNERADAAVTGGLLIDLVHEGFAALFD
ncbi:MAG TPA: zf-TFIIB domain-containing protein [Usitatibacteraceae bacterium]